MIITAWILLIAFGILAITGFYKFFFSSLNWFHAIVWIFSIIVCALSAGILFGGLFS